MIRLHGSIPSMMAIATLLVTSAAPSRAQITVMDEPDAQMDEPLEEVTAADELIGHWQSLACELRPNEQFLTREFILEADRWSGSFPNYADPACTTLNLTFYAEGSYAVIAPSTAIAGAVDADFAIDAIRLTPHSVEATAFLNSADPGTCGADPWVMDVEQEVTTTGCSVMGIDLSEPLVEYETVLVLGDYLFFGARPLDGSGLSTPEKRPTALQIPLVRGE